MMQGRYESGKIRIPNHIAEIALELAAVKTVKKTTGKTTGKKADKDAKDKTGDAVKKASAAKKEKAKKAPKAGGKKEPVLIIESLMGGTITTEEILSRLPAGIDKVYIKPEENKAYWVKGKKSGDVDLW